MKSVLISALMLVCIACGVALVPVCEQLDKRFSSPSSEAKFCYVRELGFYRITAYCPCKICCGKWADGFTASGRPAVGLIVAAPSTIPFGTVLDIPGYGVGSVQDRGGAITGASLDVLFATHAEAKEWGVKWLMVKEME